MTRILNYLMENQDIWNLGIILLFVSGMRVGELVALKPSDFEDNCIMIRRTESHFKGSDGHTRYEVKEFPKTAAGVRDIVIPHDYLWVITKLKHLNPFSEYVFVNGKGERMTTNCIGSS